MDKIRFEKEVLRLDWMTKDGLFAQILINDRPLLDMVRAYERDFVFHDRAAPEKHGGQYLYQFADNLYDQITNPESREDEEYLGLMICTCGIEGCRPFVARMEETEDQVIWRDLHNWQINGDYSQFWPFSFDKIQFWEEVKKLKSW